MNRFTIKTDNMVVPASQLDNILVKKGKNIEYNLHSFYDGKVIKNFPQLYSEIVEKTKNKFYETIDHLPFSMKNNETTFCYLSLDNSVRANKEGYALKNRLDNICNLIKNFIEECNNSCIIFFSESCRPSFDGDNFIDRKNEVTWYQIRLQIVEKCGLYYLGESANNDNPNNMSFGISGFCTNDLIKKVTHVLPKRILNEGTGSGALGIKVNNCDPVWGIHFPIDFRNKGCENLGAKTMYNLCELMKQYGDDTCAIGDFNTIVGNPMDSINNALDNSIQFIFKDIITFFGAHYDQVIPNANETWTPLID